jgi:hypothetical protein
MAITTYRYKWLGPIASVLANQLPPSAPSTILATNPSAFVDVQLNPGDPGSPAESDLEVTMAQLGWTLVATNPTNPLPVSNPGDILFNDGTGEGGVALGVPLEFFGAVGNNQAKDSAALIAAVAAVNAGIYPGVYVGGKKYNVTGANVQLMKGFIRGAGPTSILHTDGDGPIIKILGDPLNPTVGFGENTEISTLNFEGSGRGSGHPTQQGLQIGDAAVPGSGIAFGRFNNLTFRGFDGIGISYAQNPLTIDGFTHIGPIFDNIVVDKNTTGISVQTRGEYIQFVNTCGQSNGWAVTKDAGNVTFVNSAFTNNDNGVDVTNGPNSAHGAWIGCYFNHNSLINFRYGSLLGEKIIGGDIYQGGAGSITIMPGAIGLIIQSTQIDVFNYVFGAGCSVQFIDVYCDNNYGNAVTTDPSAEVIVSNARMRLDNSVPIWFAPFIQNFYPPVSDADATISAQQGVLSTLIVTDRVFTAKRTLTNPQIPATGYAQLVINDQPQALGYQFTTGLPITIPANQWADIGANGANALIKRIGANAPFQGFDPTALALQGWFQATFRLVPWLGTASAGTSGARSLSVGTAGQGTPVNGHVPSTYDGVATVLDGGVASLFMSVAAWRFTALVKPTVAVAPNVNPAFDPCIFSCSNGDLSIGFSTAGWRISQFDGAFKVAGQVCPVGVYSVLDCLYDGANISVSVNGVSGAPVAAGNVASLAGDFLIGSNFNNSARLTGSILDIITGTSVIAGMTPAQYINYCKTRYAGF